MTALTEAELAEVESNCLPGNLWSSMQMARVIATYKGHIASQDETIAKLEAELAGLTLENTSLHQQLANRCDTCGAHKSLPCAHCGAPEWHCQMCCELEDLRKWFDTEHSERMADLTRELAEERAARRSLLTELWDGVRAHGFEAPEKGTDAQRIIHAYCGGVLNAQCQLEKANQELSALRKQYAAVDVEEMAKAGCEAAHLADARAMTWDEMKPDYRRATIAGTKRIIELATAHLRAAPPQQEPAEQASRGESIGEQTGESCSMCGRANTWHPDCPTCRCMDLLEQRALKAERSLKELESDDLMHDKLKRERISKLEAERDDLKAKLAEAEEENDRQEQLIGEFRVAPMLRFDPDDVEPSDIAREITELRAKLAEAERNVNRLTLYAKEEVERLRNDRDELVRLFGELWGECCPDCGPRDFKGIVELVSKERDQLRTKLTEAERQQREFADGQFTMLADHYGAPVQWEHHPGQVVTLNPMGRINRLVADLRGECDQLRQRAEGLERNKESEDKEWMASIGNMARLAQSHLNEIDRLAAELTEIKAETVEYVLDGGDFNWTAAVIAIRDWRERAGVCDKLQSELAAARRREEGMRRACEPLRRFAAAYAQSAWTDSDRIGVPHVASFTVGEARAFLAALSPEPAPPSEVPAGEREFVCPGCGGPICTNPDANGNLCCRRRVAHDREGCGWHGTWAEVAAAKAADNTKGAAN